MGFTQAIPMGISQGSNTGGGIADVQPVKQGNILQSAAAQPPLVVPDLRAGTPLTEQWSVTTVYIPFGLLLGTNPASTQPTSVSLMLQLLLAGQPVWTAQIDRGLVATASTSNWIANDSLRGDLVNPVTLTSVGLTLQTAITFDQGVLSYNLGLCQQITAVTPSASYMPVTGAITYEIVAAPPITAELRQ